MPIKRHCCNRNITKKVVTVIMVVTLNVMYLLLINLYKLMEKIIRKMHAALRLTIRYDNNNYRKKLSLTFLLILTYKILFDRKYNLIINGTTTENSLQRYFGAACRV